MEWLKNMGLKRAFFFLTFAGLLAALFLVAAVWIVCEKISSGFPSGGMAIDFSGKVTVLEQPTLAQERIISMLRGIEILSCILFPAALLSIAGIIFYHCKLKRPIAALQEGTERIREHDLNFSILEIGRDELGQVCGAFEMMRRELFQTNRELWRQMEESKRLNAAFSHNLRNPVTVLKGTVTLLRQGVHDEQTIERLDIYTARIERYIDAMNRYRHVEQIPVQAREVSFRELSTELKETARLLAPFCEAEIICPDAGEVMLDHGLFLTVAENLIGNASRFAKQKMQITIALLSEKFLSLTVKDDGPGYPKELLKDGPKPFGRLENDGEHFGMGLYSSLVLCQKHGGSLTLCNDSGAAARAVFELAPGLHNKKVSSKSENLIK